MNQLNEYVANLENCKNIINEISDLVVVKDKDFVYRYCNDAFCDLISKNSNEINGKNDFELFEFNEAEETRLIDIDIIKDASSIIIDRQMTTSKGKLWLSVCISAIIINEEVIGLKFIAKNINDVIDSHSNEILIDSQHTILTALLNSMDMLIYSIDEDYKFTSYNINYKNSMKNIWGESISEGVSIFDYITNDKEITYLKSIFDRVFSDESIIIYKNDLITNENFEQKFIPIKKYERIIGITVITTNISERIKKEEKINLLTYAIEQSDSSIVITDLKGNIEYVNSAFSKVTGYEISEVLGQNPNILNSGKHNSEFYRELWEAVLSGNTWNGEIINKNKAGELYWENASISPIRDSNNKIFKILGIKQNITEQKLMEEEQNKLIEDILVARDTIEENIANQHSLIYELSQTQEKLEKINNEKDRFFSIIAHDLKNPFVTLLNNSEMLDIYFDKMDDNAKLKMIRDIKQTSKLTYSLLENLLQWSRSQMGSIQYSPYNINLFTMLTKTGLILKSQAALKGIEISINCDENIFGYCDSDMIDTVLRNLVSNAIKFSNNNGTININVCEYEFDNGYYQITVKDNGIGMNEVIINKLFSITENISRKGTNNEKGTGLGLLLCKDFVEMNDGRIWAESKVEEGSNFHFTLPKAVTESE